MSGYLKRYVIPGFWPVNRKKNKWAPRPRAGSHALSSSMPLQTIVRDVLKITDNIPETRNVIKSGEIQVDSRKRTDTKYPVGFMDVISIPKINKNYRILLNKKGLHAEEIKASDKSKKLCVIKGKKKIKGGKIQLSLHDGRNILIDKDVYNVGDSVLISLPEQKIATHFKFEKGADSFIISGKNKGLAGKIAEIKERKSMLEKSMVTIQSKEGAVVVPIDYVMVGAI